MGRLIHILIVCWSLLKLVSEIVCKEYKELLSWAKCKDSHRSSSPAIIAHSLYIQRLTTKMISLVILFVLSIDNSTIFAHFR